MRYAIGVETMVRQLAEERKHNKVSLRWLYHYYFRSAES